MNLKSLTNENLILLNCSYKKKEDVIASLIEAMDTQGVLSSKKEFYDAVMERESQSPTGLEEGLAIPHGKSTAVKRATIAVARLNNPIEEWESVEEDNKVDLVFLIAIPKSEQGSTHIEVLTKLTTSFMKDGFIEKLRKAKTSKEMIDAIQSADSSVETAKEVRDTGKVVLAVTACATGIAHTFMAAEALEKAGRELGITVITEKQGANGITDRFTDEDIRRADAIIFATDVSAKETERFAGLNFIQTRVATPLKESKNLLNRALNSPDGIMEKKASKTENKAVEGGVVGELKRAFLTGISYMIPLVIAGAVIMGIARIGGSIFGVSNIWDGSHLESSNALVRVFHTMDGLGGRALGFMLPFIAGFVAFSFADRAGIVPGFIGGLLAKELNAGFLGALIAGVIAGYTVKMVLAKIKLPGFAAGITSILIAPVLGTLVTGMLMLYVIGKPVGEMNKLLEVWLMGMSGSNKIVLAAIIGGMVGFDLGGPVNKAAVTTAMALLASGITTPNTAAQVAIIVPPIGLGLATILGKHKYDKSLQEAGKSSILMGLVGISEGAIPFAIESPLKVIPVTVIGSALASAMAVALGANNPAPISGFYGWFTIEKWPIYVLSVFVGAAFIAVTSVFLRNTEKEEDIAEAQA